MNEEQRVDAFDDFFATVFCGADFSIEPYEDMAVVRVATSAGVFCFTAEQARSVADYVAEYAPRFGAPTAALVAALLTDQADEAERMGATAQ